MPQAKTTTTVVRTAVARFESTCATPTLASSAVAAAKRAESSAQAIQLEVQLMGNMVRAWERVCPLHSKAWSMGRRAGQRCAWQYGARRIS